MKEQIEKQAIEEMARGICHLSAECETCQICDERYNTGGELCYFKCMANEIIHHGYRKQSEGEWESFPSLGTAYRCSVCKEKAENKSKFCPNCGAHMRGGKNE